MIELCFFSLDQWEIKIHLIWGKCFNIPHWPRSHSTNRRLQHIEKLSKTYSHLDQTKLNGLLLLTIHGVLAHPSELFIIDYFCWWGWNKFWTTVFSPLWYVSFQQRDGHTTAINPLIISFLRGDSNVLTARPIFLIPVGPLSQPVPRSGCGWSAGWEWLVFDFVIMICDFVILWSAGWEWLDCDFVFFNWLCWEYSDHDYCQPA